jgi:hypothetical protein
MKLLQYISLALLGIFLFSCETTIDFEGNTPEQLLVLNSIVSPDSVVKAHLSKSKFFLESGSQIETVNDGTVKLYVNGQFKENMQASGEGIYKANYKPHVDDLIRITASKSPFKEISGESAIVPHIKIAKFDSATVINDSSFVIQSVYDDKKATFVPDTLRADYDCDMNMKINFKDSVSYKNYYRLRAFFLYYEANGSVDVRNVNIKSSDEVFTGAGSAFAEKDDGYFEFSDELFAGKTYSVSLNVPFRKSVYYKQINSVGSTGKDNSVVKIQLVVDLQSISESMYLYLRSNEAQDNYDGFFSEPVQIHNNIQNGIGILGTVTSNYVIVNLPLNYDANVYF